MKNFLLSDVASIGDKVIYSAEEGTKIVSKIINIDTERNTIQTTIDNNINISQLYDRRYTMQITEDFKKNSKKLQTIIKFLPRAETTGKDENDCWVIAPQLNMPVSFQVLQM